MADPLPAAAAYPWTPDLGDGRYRNPVLFADYSDPDVIRVGDDFWLTASSFNCTPGLPILHSHDLVNWTLVNHALKNLPHSRYDAYQGGCGVWAPAIRYHDRKFWIFYPTPDEGIYVVTADNPRGTWSEPRPVIEGKGLIDPCPLWDSDGRAYLAHAYAKSRAGIKNIIRVRPMAPDASGVLGEGEIVFNDPINHPTMEGPKFHQWNGMYYLSVPAGGVATGWQVILRSKSVYGPYESKIVLAQGKTDINGPHQGALLDTPTGEWWFMHFQERQPYGRITHLQPVTWKDGWPLIGINQDENDLGEPVTTHRKPNVGKTYPVAIPATSDEFDAQRLGLAWQWNANHRDDWHTLTNRPGLRLFARPAGGNDLLHLPHLLAQKFPALAFSVETRIEIPESMTDTEAGLAVIGYKHAAVILTRKRDGVSAISLRVDGKTTVEIPFPRAAARFRVTIQDGGRCRFAYRGDDEAAFIEIDHDFQASEGHWIGARVGLFCSGAAGAAAYADVDYFRFS
ncbi:MAG: glycoside hydrolase 43 family protein [Burkholderiales bacterium]|nr:glycoside hydrolase 43 family protein [Phycisphaerae bacterium]